MFCRRWPDSTISAASPRGGGRAFWLVTLTHQPLTNEDTIRTARSSSRCGARPGARSGCLDFAAAPIGSGRQVAAVPPTRTSRKRSRWFTLRAVLIGYDDCLPNSCWYPRAQQIGLAAERRWWAGVRSCRTDGVGGWLVAGSIQSQAGDCGDTSAEERIGSR